MNISESTDFTKLTDAELLLIKDKWAIVLDSVIYKKTINEMCRRQQVKENEIYKTHQKNEKTQRKIKIMTFVIMIFTAIILVFAIAQFIKTPTINHSLTYEKPPTHSEKP